RPYAHLEQVASSIVFDHPARYRGTTSAVLDPRSRGPQRVRSLVAVHDLERHRGAPAAAARAGLLHRHARVERSLLHPGDTRLSEDSAGSGSIRGALSESRPVDILDLVQRASRCNLLRLLSA